MRKTCFALVCALCCVTAIAQSFNNEWIDYSKTYYKFKVGRTGVYRLNLSALSSIGLANEPVQNLQVWRNGKQVPLYTSATSGAIGGGYIEFWGEQNDGVPDKNLYRTPDLQLSDRLSLQTDTAAFFLTTNSAGGNLRYDSLANNVAGNSLAAESSFIYTSRLNFKDRIHKGFARVTGGEYLYSSSYDGGEMWATGDITPSSPYYAFLNNLAVASNSSTPASFRIALAGGAPYDRSYSVSINNTNVIQTSLSLFDAQVNSAQSVPLSAISSNNATIVVTNSSSAGDDRIVAGFCELTYPRQFNFGNQSNFAFSMPSSAVNRYLEISNFNTGSIPPVLYDLTNNRRYTTSLSSGVVKVVLQPSSVASNLVLVSQAADNIIPVNSFVQKNFINYAVAANQGDYLIISNPLLRTQYQGADQVEQYRAYRSSATGGSYNAKIYDINDLVDQFAFGIKKHPLSIKNFLRFIRASAGSVSPKYVFLLGKGVTYDDYRVNESLPQSETLNLVPTWGYPASDVLLSSNTLEPIMTTPIGRISVVSPVEIADYLSKVKQYEQAQQNSLPTIDSAAWKKTVVHVAGGNDANLDIRLASYFSNYENIIKDTSFGGRVITFNKTTTGPVTPAVSAFLGQTFQKGISLITYFGHSSASSLDYNLNNPYDYNNAGKYPIFIVNGCNAGNLFSFDTSRFSVLSSLSETWVLAKNRGSVGFIASTHFGLENYLDFYTGGLYKSMGVTGYGKGIAENIQFATDSLRKLVGSTDYFGRIHAEETTLHGDPAVKLNSAPKPDFDIEEPQIKVTPANPSLADDKFSLKAYIYNLGKATGDSVSVQVKRQYPNGITETLLAKKIKAVRYIDSVSLDVPIIASRDNGQNKITVSVDNENLYAELSELNNAATKVITFTNELLPVYPYNLGIVNKASIKLAASTADPFAPAADYTMELDTTELFNSPLKVTKTVNSAGGVIQFDPGFTFTDNTVYYWRVAPSALNSRWNTASFLYLNGSSTGFNQSHFYQQTKSANQRILLDSATRSWKYTNNLNNLTIVNSIYPTSGTEDNQFSVAVNGSIYIASTCDGPVIQFNVFDPVTFKPWKNIATNGKGMNGSVASCSPTRDYNFDFLIGNPAQRLNATKFMDSIPNGFIVVVRDIVSPDASLNTYAKDWKADTSINGPGNSLYHRLFAQGFSNLDAFDKPKAYGFVYKKNKANELTPAVKMSDGVYDRITLSVDVATPDTLGFITSPKFGPAKQWRQVKWRGTSLEATAGDAPVLSVIGIRTTGVEDTLYKLRTNQQDFDISAVSAVTYPNIRLSMRNIDSVTLTPYQPTYWRVLYDQVPEGAIATNVLFKGKDSAQQTETYEFAVAFKNVSDTAFSDSLKVNMLVYDKNNVPHSITMPNLKKLQPGDTATIRASFNLANYDGNNLIYVDVNPASQQIEQFHSNNFLYKNLYVQAASMPVTLTNFNAYLQGTDVKTMWTVETESNIRDYTVQHSVNGRVFSTLGQVQAINRGGTVSNYEFTHLNAPLGKNYYRLLISDKDGSTKLSPVRLVTVSKGAVVNIYPNPVKDKLTVVFNSRAGNAATIKLLNAFGQQLLQKVVTGTVTLDMSSFANGTYMLQVDNGGEVKTYKVEKQ